MYETAKTILCQILMPVLCRQTLTNQRAARRHQTGASMRGFRSDKEHAQNS